MMNEPITGIGVPIRTPTMLPNMAPTSDSATARRLAPCFAAPAAPATNSITSPSTASPAATPTVTHPIPRPASCGNNHANPAASATTSQFPGSVKSDVSHAAMHSTTSTQRRRIVNPGRIDVPGGDVHSKPLYRQPINICSKKLSGCRLARFAARH